MIFTSYFGFPSAARNACRAHASSFDRHRFLISASWLRFGRFERIFGNDRDVGLAIGFYAVVNRREAFEFDLLGHGPKAKGI